MGGIYAKHKKSRHLAISLQLTMNLIAAGKPLRRLLKSSPYIDKTSFTGEGFMQNIKRVSLLSELQMV